MRLDFDLMIRTVDLILSKFGDFLEILFSPISSLLSEFWTLIVPQWIQQLTLIEFMFGTGFTVILSVIVYKFLVGVTELPGLVPKK